MLHSLYLIVAVLFRVLSMLALVWASFLSIAAPMWMRTPGASILAVVPLVLAIALWVLSKPIARMVTRDLQ